MTYRQTCGLVADSDVCISLQGSTDGIGKELAKQLAKKGFNIVLVGRTPSKLVTAKAEVGDNASFSLVSAMCPVFRRPVSLFCLPFASGG